MGEEEMSVEASEEESDVEEAGRGPENVERDKERERKQVGREKNGE